MGIGNLRSCFALILAFMVLPAFAQGGVSQADSAVVAGKRHMVYISGGASVITSKVFDEYSAANNKAAFTLGHYSFGPDGYTATWQNHLFVHEYGHYIQSQRFGPAYLPIIGLASLESAGYQDNWGGGPHRNRWFEVNASRLGAEHFDKKYGSGAAGYKENSPNYFNKTAFSDGSETRYINPQTGRFNQGDEHPISSPHISFWDFIPFL